MKRSLLALVAVVSSAILGCGSATTSDSSYEGSARADGTGGTGGDTPGTGTPGSGTADPSGSGTPGENPGDPQTTGVLTAGVWDDNLNFDFFGKYMEQSKVLKAGSIFSQAERDDAHVRASKRTAKNELDVAIVLDTTSSMGDEIHFLQDEFEAISSTIKAKFPGILPRFGLVVYRDHSDAYLTQSTPFTSNVEAFKATLKAQSADGGGDLPEAVPEGLSGGVALDWRTAPGVARVMFWVADAPQHPGEEKAVHDAVLTAVQKDIHVYPVASSGVDATAEVAMRGTAQVTGGRYVFLTDDSGVGNSHAEPHIPCYVVTKLQGALVRMVESEMKGTRVEPAPSDVIRSVGAPTDGKCSLQDKSQVTLY